MRRIRDSRKNSGPALPVALAMAPRLVSIIGSRPEIIQAAPLSLAYSGRVEEILVHTGQHYDPGMSDHQIADLRLPLPEYNLGVGSLPNRRSVEVAQKRIAGVLESEQPDAVLVRGDTNATIAGARAAVAAEVPLLHVEAGLRSYRDDMPEEHNRIETDRLSEILFAPCDHARQVLVEEERRGHRARHRRRPRRRPSRHPGPARGERGGGRLRAWRPCTATTTPTAPSGSAPSSPASPRPSAE